MAKKMIVVLCLLFASCTLAADLTIGTFNIKMYSSSDTDDDLVWDAIDQLNIDVLAVQEILDPQQLKTLVETKSNGAFTFITYEGNTSWSQKIGFVYDKNTVEPIGPIEIITSTMYDSDGSKHNGWRPAHHAFFKAKNDGFDFHIIAVHMAGPSGDEEDRRKQWRNVQQTIREANLADQDIIVLGDFNCYEGYGLFESMIVDGGFSHITEETATYCYNGNYSFLDNILVSDGIQDEEYTNQAIVAKYEEFEGDFSCADFTLSDYYEKVSDHLPVVTTFTNVDNDSNLTNDNVSLFSTSLQYNGPVIGNKRSKIFHHPDSNTLPSEKNRVKFDSVSDAIAAGYRAAKNWDWK